MKKSRQKRISIIRLMIIVLFLSFASYGFFYPLVYSKTSDSMPNVSATPKTKTQPKTQAKNTKYSEFPHDNPQHSSLACDSCHKFPSANWKSVRKADEAFPDITDYPKHESCLNCHRQQFFSGSPPVICSICHTNPSPNDSSRHPFPNPREVFDLSAKGKNHVSDFQIFFPHDKHIEIVSRNETTDTQWVKASFPRNGKTRAGEESCSVCHKTYQPQGNSDDEYFTKPPDKLGERFWLKKGTFKSSPTSHTLCFTCHSQDTGILPAPENCGVCHKIAPQTKVTDFDAKLASTMGITDKNILLAWRKRDSSATFRHEFSSHSELECATCHNVSAMNTIEPLTKKVAVSSCNMCHITATTDDGGILNFEIDSRKKNPNFQCVKCHINFGKSPIPDSHFKVISDNN